jgi:hypothetical protein
MGKIYTSYQLFVESLQENNNSPEDVRVKELGQKMAEFNTGKSKLDAIFNKKEDTWEDEAEKVIGTNEYLSMYWRASKVKKSILTNQESVVGKSPEEVKMVQDTVTLQTNQLKDLEKELNAKMIEDKKLLN